MRINHNTHPALSAIIDGSIFLKTTLYADDAMKAYREKKELGRPLISTASMLALGRKEDFLENIFFVSRTFEDAANRARDTLHRAYLQIDNIDISGTYIIGSTVSCISFQIKNKEVVNLTFCAFDKSGKALSFYIDDKVDCSTYPVTKAFFFPEQTRTIYPVSWSALYLRDSEAAKNSKDVSKYLASRLIMIELFRRYAEVECVTVNAKKRGHFNGEKVLNETLTDITFLDSKWFRNITRTEGFAVRGHFRLQPKKKDGEWTRELIWINNFEKHGYHSKARILSNAITA